MVLSVEDCAVLGMVAEVVVAGGNLHILLACQIPLKWGVQIGHSQSCFGEWLKWREGLDAGSVWLLSDSLPVDFQ